MLESKVIFLDKNRICQITILRDRSPLSYRDVIDGWRNSETFRQFYLALLAEAPMTAFFWESLPITRSTVDRAYEFVLVDSPQLVNVQPDRFSFASFFESADPSENVTAFDNLGGDAILVVPCPRSSDRVYVHLAEFVRSAPDTQQHELFQKLAEEIDRRLSDRPMWVSTSGLGVFWIHIRLDSRPKYYTFQPYRINVSC
jgi:hypothetical protein